MHISAAETVVNKTRAGDIHPPPSKEFRLLVLPVWWDRPHSSYTGFRIASCDSDQCASGLGRSWKRSTLLVVPFPVSRWTRDRVEYVAHKPLPFHPAFGSSMRPSSHLA